jgi:hypothetical protein
MQSIAPDMVYIEVTGAGVEIGGVKRPIGWKGEVSRTSARYLLAAKKAVPASAVKTEVVQESVDAAPDVAYDAKESATEEGAVETSRAAPRFSRKRNK